MKIRKQKLWTILLVCIFVLINQTVINANLSPKNDDQSLSETIYDGKKPIGFAVTSAIKKIDGKKMSYEVEIFDLQKNSLLKKRLVKPVSSKNLFVKLNGSHCMFVFYDDRIAQISTEVYGLDGELTREFVVNNIPSNWSKKIHAKPSYYFEVKPVNNDGFVVRYFDPSTSTGGDLNNKIQYIPNRTDELGWTNKKHFKLKETRAQSVNLVHSDEDHIVLFVGDANGLSSTNYISEKDTYKFIVLKSNTGNKFIQANFHYDKKSKTLEDKYNKFINSWKLRDIIPSL